MVWVKGKDIVGKNVFEFIQPADEERDVEQLNNVEVFIKHTPTNNFIISSQPLSSVEKKRYVLIIKRHNYGKRNRNLKRGFCCNFNA